MKKDSKIGHGAIGSSLFEATTIHMDNIHPGDEPSELDERLNPHTGLPIKNSQRYPREPVPLPNDDEDVDSLSSSTNEAAPLSTWDMPLKEESQTRLAKDKATYIAKLDKYNAEAIAKRAQDDALLQHMQSTIPNHLQSTIATHIDYHNFDTRPQTYYQRSKDYLHMTLSVFSTGNARLATKNIRRTVNDPQGETAIQIWLPTFEANWAFAVSSIEDPQHKGYVKLDALKFLFINSNINMENPANIQAVNNYHLAHKFAMLPQPLISELITQNLALSSHTADPISQQGSALIAQKSTFGSKKPNRDDHCTFCLTDSGKSKLYFYHPLAKCNKKKAADAKTAAKMPVTALLAAGPTTTTTAPAQPMWPPMEFEQMFNAQIAKQVANMDNVSVMSNINYSQP